MVLFKLGKRLKMNEDRTGLVLVQDDHLIDEQSLIFSNKIYSFFLPNTMYARELHNLVLF
jgi:hypothetical protein